MPSTQPPTNRPCLPIHITTLIAPQEQRRARHLISNSAPLQRIQLPNLPLRAARPRLLKHRRRHARLDQARADRVHPDAGGRELVRRRLRDGDHGRLAGGVVA